MLFLAKIRRLVQVILRIETARELENGAKVSKTKPASLAFLNDYACLEFCGNALNGSSGVMCSRLRT